MTNVRSVMVEDGSSREQRCPKCDGDGVVYVSEKCSSCDGNGWTRSLWGDLNKCSSCGGGKDTVQEELHARNAMGEDLLSRM